MSVRVFHPAPNDAIIYSVATICDAQMQAVLPREIGHIGLCRMGRMTTRIAIARGDEDGRKPSVGQSASMKAHKAPDGWINREWRL